MACKPNPSNPTRDVRRDIAGLLLNEKRPLYSAGVFGITGGPKEIVRITCSDLKPSFFDDVRYSNFGVTDMLESAG